MDALSETLRVVQLTGAIFIHARFTAPWCVQSPSADVAAPLLEPGAERIVIFHLVTEGECHVEMEQAAPVRLVAGDVVLFPQGHAHRMASRPGLPPAAGAPLGTVLARRPRQLSYGGGGARTRLVCGYLACDARLGQLLLAGLPRLVKVNVRESNAGPWLEASLRYALAEARSPRPGGAGVLAKLAELLFIEVLRLYMHGEDGPRLDAGSAGARGRLLALGAGRALPAARRPHAHAIPRALAHAAGRPTAAQRHRPAHPHRARHRLPDRHRLQPRLPPRIRSAARHVAARAAGARCGARVEIAAHCPGTRKSWLMRPPSSLTRSRNWVR